MRFAAGLAEKIPEGSVVALHGALGAGKTVFARGFARGLGIKSPVTSPSFTIVQEYRLESGKRFCHLDLYRIHDENSAYAFGIEEYLNGENAATLIEWAERIGRILPGKTIHVFLEHASENERRIKIN